MRFFITGTDTDVGKTVAASWLMLHFGARYWKPVQAGTHTETDEQIVRRLTEFPPEQFSPSTYIFPDPLSPHEAARRCGASIEMDRFTLPEGDAPLMVEGAGGLLVPLNGQSLVIDLIEQLNLPAILVARAGLGTINHTLMSMETMRHRGIDIAGVILNGQPEPHNRKAIETYGKVQIIAEIPLLPALNRAALLDIPPLIDLNQDLLKETVRTL